MPLRPLVIAGHGQQAVLVGEWRELRAGGAEAARQRQLVGGEQVGAAVGPARPALRLPDAAGVDLHDVDGLTEVGGAERMRPLALVIGLSQRVVVYEPAARENLLGVPAL